MTTPAQQLVGKVLEDGWAVTKKVSRLPTSTGGTFSCGYIVERGKGEKGFLKALDLMAAFSWPDSVTMLNSLTKAFLFEREICEKTSHLSRVARAVGSGEIQVNPSNPSTRVPYLIFELAAGDVRAHLDMHAGLDEAFIFKTLHHVAVGLKQLHQAKMAHQDLKPSNVLIYAGQQGAKICDLGRAWDSRINGPHDDLQIAGDSNYAPIDLLYYREHDSIESRRYGCDLYHLGSLVAFMLTRTHMNALYLSNLHRSHQPYEWAGTFDEILPILINAFENSLHQIQKNLVCGEEDRIRQILTQLCHPDPRVRGNPVGKGGGRYTLHWYISVFDLLAHKAKLATSGKLNRLQKWQR